MSPQTKTPQSVAKSSKRPNKPSKRSKPTNLFEYQTPENTPKKMPPASRGRALSTPIELDASCYVSPLGRFSSVATRLPAKKCPPPPKKKTRYSV